MDKIAIINTGVNGMNAVISKLLTLSPNNKQILPNNRNMFINKHL